MIAFQDRQGMPKGPAIRSKRRVIARQPRGARRPGFRYCSKRNTPPASARRDPAN